MASARVVVVVVAAAAAINPDAASARAAAAPDAGIGPGGAKVVEAIVAAAEGWRANLALIRVTNVPRLRSVRRSRRPWRSRCGGDGEGQGKSRLLIRLAYDTGGNTLKCSRLFFFGFWSERFYLPPDTAPSLYRHRNLHAFLRPSIAFFASR